jgi:hypothetical protein
MKKILIVSFVIIIAAASGYGLQRMLGGASAPQQRVSAPTAAIDVINQQRPAFSLKDIDGEVREISGPPGARRVKRKSRLLWSYRNNILIRVYRSLALPLMTNRRSGTLLTPWA